MPGVIDSLVKRFAAISGGDIISLAIFLISASLIINGAKNIVRLLAAIVGTLAILYILDPGLYDYISGLVGNAISTVSKDASGILSSFHR